jgi:hypothetical protein
MHELSRFHPGRRRRAATVIDFERASLELLALFKARLLPVSPRSQ